MCFKSNQNVGILLLFVVSHVVVKMAESFGANTISRFRSPKIGEEESKLFQGSIPKSTAYKTKWAVKIFHQWQINRGYYMTARGYEFYLRVFNSISHE